MTENRTSHNVGLLCSIEGKVQRYKGQLVIPLSSFGTGFDEMPNGGIHKQGGIVFESDEIALKLMNELQDHFKDHQITLTKDVYGWAWKLYKKIVLKIRVYFIKRKWKRERKMLGNLK